MKLTRVALPVLVLLLMTVFGQAATFPGNRGIGGLPPGAFPDDRAMGAVPLQGTSGAKVTIGIQDVIRTVEDMFRSDSQGMQPLNDVTADFFQRSILAAKGRELRADGQMLLRFAGDGRPLMFRFDYFRPTRHEIVCDGRTLWTYLPENRQVILSDVSFAFNTFVNDQSRDRGVNFIQGLGRISRDYQISFSSQQFDAQGNYILELLPRRSMVSIEKIYMVVHRDSVFLHKQGIPLTLSTQELLFPIRSTTVIDHEGNSTIMEFSNIKANSKLQPSLFNFIVPADVQVVKPPRGY